MSELPQAQKPVGLLRRLFDERTFGDRPTPFAIDRMLLVLPALAAVGFALGWLGGSLAGSSDPVDLGCVAAVAVAMAYWLAVTIGTVGYRIHDRAVRISRRRRAIGPFETSWHEANQEALRALGPAASAITAMTADLWHLADDRPRAVVMEAFARFTRELARQPVPPAVTRAYTSLSRLQRMAVLHEEEPSPLRAKEFLHLCDLALNALRKA